MCIQTYVIKILYNETMVDSTLYMPQQSNTYKTPAWRKKDNKENPNLSQHTRSPHSKNTHNSCDSTIFVLFQQKQLLINKEAHEPFGSNPMSNNIKFSKESHSTEAEMQISAEEQIYLCAFWIKSQIKSRNLRTSLTSSFKCHKMNT